MEGAAVDVQPDPAGLEQLIVAAPKFDAAFKVYGNCPVQGCGTVLGRDLYFRARHDGWSFDVADHAGNLASDSRSRASCWRRSEFMPTSV